MKGSSASPVQPSDDAELLRFLTIDYRWMVRDGILRNTAANWRAFDQGYRASDARQRSSLSGILALTQKVSRTAPSRVVPTEHLTV